MNETDNDTGTAPASTRDPLGELIRAAGRRSPPPREHYESVLAASRLAWQAKVLARKRRRWYALAASLAVICGAAAVFYAAQRMERAPVASLAVAEGEVTMFSVETGAWQPLSSLDMKVLRGDRLRTGTGGRAAFAIAGGGSLRINSETELLLNAPDALRLVAGTLYVDSGSRATTDPIEIATPLGVVRDIGTQFEVRSTTESLRVRVRTGGVELVESPYASDFRSLAGQEFELAASGALRLREIAPDDDQWGWAATLAVVPEIENRSILGYLQWIARETGKPLRFDSPNTELRAQFVSWNGDARGLTPLQILDSIAATSDFVYELTEQGAILIRRSEALR